MSAPAQENVPSTIPTSDIDQVVDEIYKQYFQRKVCDKKNYDKNKNLQKPLMAAKTNQDIDILPTARDIWIFGYGSLVWKADFPYIDRRPGFIRGYQRRFYQHSIDHRGTHTKPGRVVTLLHTNKHEDRVYGVAYRIAAHQKHDVLSHLDYREKNGYQRCKLVFQEFPEETGMRFDIIMYIATPENESYAGDVWQLPRIAEQIFTSAGPSGPNREYLFKLADAMRELFPGVKDEHLFELEAEVLKRIESDEEHTLERALKKKITAAVIKNTESANVVNSVDEAAKKCHELTNDCEVPGWKEALLTKELLNGDTI